MLVIFHCCMMFLHISNIHDTQCHRQFCPICNKKLAENIFLLSQPCVFSHECLALSFAANFADAVVGRVKLCVGSLINNKLMTFAFFLQCLSNSQCGCPHSGIGVMSCFLASSWCVLTGQGQTFGDRKPGNPL